MVKGLVRMLLHGVYGTTVINKTDIGPITASKMPLSRAFKKKR